MHWVLIAGIIVSALGLGGFYYLMIPAKKSPQMLLGKEFTMPDVRLRYSADTLYQTFDKAGEAGRPQMRRYWHLDFGLMAFLTGAMMAVTANIATAGTWIYITMLTLSAARTAVDVCEDLLFLHLLRRYPTRQNGLAKFAGTVTTLKHILLIAWVALLFFLLVLSAFSISK